ncbi:SURF1 family protein [bacterium]|nr:SURF1 family protein [bacterium]
MLRISHFRFSLRITLLCCLLATGMLRLSYWQWERYGAKERYLQELERRLRLPVVPLEELLREVGVDDPEALLHRRVVLEGRFDFEHEIVKRNRKDSGDGPGVHVITPFLLQESGRAILINRGYIPLLYAGREKRVQFQKDAPERFIGLIKLTEEPRSFLSPSDPPSGGESSRVDAWLRVDIEQISQQIPYPLLPFQGEMMSTAAPEEVEAALVDNSDTRNEIFYLSDNMNKVSTGELNPNRSYPVPAFSTVVPSATHLLYVIEWAFMAFLTLLIGFGLQCRSRHRLVEAAPLE